MIHLKTPLKDGDIKKLRVGNRVLLSGIIFTARDMAHRFFLENDFPKINGSVIYHCGPLVDHNKIIAAGPTTSSRMNIYRDVIKKYNIKAIIGKAGMDSKTSEILKNRAVYLSAVGGAALIYAEKIKKILNVYKPEFGMPEAIYEIMVRDFPAIVTMDSHGGSLHKDILEKSENSVKFLSEH